MSRVEKRADKLERLAYSAQVMHKLSDLEARIDELEDALDASGWVYFTKKYAVDKAREDKDGLKQRGEGCAGKAGSGGVTSKGSGDV